MAKRKKAAAPSSPEQVSIPWAISLAGLHEGWSAIVPPIQLLVKDFLEQKDSYSAKSYSIVGGIAESKKKRINDSGLLDVALEEIEDTSAEPAPVTPTALRTTVAVLEAASNAGLTRMCDGHSETERNSGRKAAPAVCYRCHPPSQWPGSPEQQTENVDTTQLQEWTRLGLESIVRALEAILNKNPRKANDYATAAAIHTDKVVDGTVRKRRAALTGDYLRHARHQFCRLAYTLRDEQITMISERLQAGGMPEEEIPPAIMALATSLPLSVMEQKNTSTLASLAYKVTSAVWSMRRRAVA